MMIRDENIFTKKASAYRESRPGYPMRYLKDLAKLTPYTIADVGSGTGILTRQLLDFGIGEEIYAIEPNDAMRWELVDYIGDNERLKVLPSFAESISIKNDSVDLITVGQAFHWFDVDRFMVEARRIATPDAHASFVWNELDKTSDVATAVSSLKEKYVEKSPELEEKKNDVSDIEKFFGKTGFEHIIYKNTVGFSKKEFHALMESHSWAPSAGEEGYEEFYKEVTVIFEQFQRKGRIELPFVCENYIGEIK
jgi:ubiquinone/menaquinone biosynthesis C-methylase UbiE